jgi:ribosome recycling factor
MIDNFKKDLQKILSEFQQKVNSVRSYNLSLSFLENIEISLYHQKYPLKSVALISQIDPFTFRLDPYDQNYLKEIETSLLERKKDLNVIKEKNSLIIKFPPLTEENKKEIIKELSKIKEEVRIKSRLLRDEYLKNVKKEKDEGKISENKFYQQKEALDKEINNFNKEVERIFNQKEKEILG